MEIGRVFEDRLGRRGQISRAAEELRHDARNRVHYSLTGVTGGNGFLGREYRDFLLPVLGQLG